MMTTDSALLSELIEEAIASARKGKGRNSLAFMALADALDDMGEPARAANLRSPHWYRDRKPNTSTMWRVKIGAARGTYRVWGDAENKTDCYRAYLPDGTVCGPYDSADHATLAILLCPLWS